MLCGIDFHDNNRRKHVGWQHAYNVPWNCNECVTSITETWMLCCCRVCHPPCLSPILTIRGGKRIATWEPSSQKLFGIYIFAEIFTNIFYVWSLILKIKLIEYLNYYRNDWISNSPILTQYLNYSGTVLSKTFI
jgi:hypothetical protein